MSQLLLADVARERHHTMLREAEMERRASQQLKVKRALRRLNKARARLDDALETAYALPARPNPVTGGDSVVTSATAGQEYEKQFV